MSQTDQDTLLALNKHLFFDSKFPKLPKIKDPKKIRSVKKYKATPDDFVSNLTQKKTHSSQQKQEIKSNCETKTKINCQKSTFCKIRKKKELKMQNPKTTEEQSLNDKFLFGSFEFARKNPATESKLTEDFVHSSEKNSIDSSHESLYNDDSISLFLSEDKRQNVSLISGGIIDEDDKSIAVDSFYNHNLFKSKDVASNEDRLRPSGKFGKNSFSHRFCNFQFGN